MTPINSLHHFDVNENWSYRDGVVTEATDDDGSWIDFGFNTVIFAFSLNEMFLNKYLLNFLIENKNR